MTQRQKEEIVYCSPSRAELKEFYLTDDDELITKPYAIPDSAISTAEKASINQKGDSALQNMVSVLDKIKDFRNKIYINNDICFGTNLDEFIESLKPQEEEKIALKTILENVKEPVVFNDATPSKIIGIAATPRASGLNHPPITFLSSINPTIQAIEVVMIIAM